MTAVVTMIVLDKWRRLSHRLSWTDTELSNAPDAAGKYWHYALVVVQ